MAAERKAPNVGKIGVQRDEQAVLLANALPQCRIGGAGQSLVMDAVGLITPLSKKLDVALAQIFVQFGRATPSA
jgi:hypothetical protein